MKIKNKSFVVTGGGNGIGRELVFNLLSKGASVTAIDRDKSFLEETFALSKVEDGKLSTHVLDVADRDSVESLAKRLISHYVAIDGIINDAGIIQPFVKIIDLDYEAIERVMAVNLYGTLYITKAFLPHLLTRPEAHIVNISSMGGFLPVPGQTIYGASKAAVKLFTEGLAAEVMDTNFSVAAVFPGAVNTNIAANSGVDGTLQIQEQQSPIKMMAPREAAQIIVDSIKRSRQRVLAGSDSRFMDIACRVAPQRAARLIAGQMNALLPS